MKRVVDGVTYNTDTSTKVAQRGYRSDDKQECGLTLYQTRGGAFFTVEEGTRSVWNQRARENQRREYVTVTPMSRDKAQEWVLGDEVELFLPWGISEFKGFITPGTGSVSIEPQATAEPEGGATIYIRVPAALKRAVDEAAADAEVSGNVWAMRCVENCLEGLPKEMTAIWYIARGLEVWGADDDEKLNPYKLDIAEKALAEISSLVESFAKRRFGTDDLSKINSAESFMTSLEAADLGRRFRPYPED